jgi:hypothetical protein
MDENELIEFSWSGLFIVTCISSFFFTLFIWLLDKHVSAFWLTVAISSLLLSIIHGLARLLQQAYTGKEKKEAEGISAD